MKINQQTTNRRSRVDLHRKRW